MIDEEGSDVVGVGRLGSGARSWDLCAFHFVLLPAKSENINGNCEKGCEGKLILPTTSAQILT